MNSIELKKWAWDKLEGWGVMTPQADDPKVPPQFRGWSLTERMAKADELIAWVLAKPKESGDGDDIPT